MSEFMDMKLIVRLDGGIQETNLSDFQTEAQLILSNVNMELVTDDDFAVADATAKDFKIVETRIDQAKQDALHSIDDISALFTVMDKLWNQFRDTRLNLEKKVKSEKANRKRIIITVGLNNIHGAIDSSPVSHSKELLAAYGPDINAAVKGKRSMDAMQEAVNEVVGFYYDKITELSELYEKNALLILKTNDTYPGLFPDFKDLALKPIDEVASEIEARIAKHKLAMIEKEKREKEEEETVKSTPELLGQVFDLPEPTSFDDLFGDEPTKSAISRQITVKMQGDEHDIKVLVDIIKDNPLVISVQ